MLDSVSWCTNGQISDIFFCRISSVLWRLPILPMLETTSPLRENLRQFLDYRMLIMAVFNLPSNVTDPSNLHFKAFFCFLLSISHHSARFRMFLVDVVFWHTNNLCLWCKLGISSLSVSLHKHYVQDCVQHLQNLRLYMTKAPITVHVSQNNAAFYAEFISLLYMPKGICQVFYNHLVGVVA